MKIFVIRPAPLKVYTNTQETLKSPPKISPAVPDAKRVATHRRMKKPMRKFSTIAEVDEEAEEDRPRSRSPNTRRTSRMKSMIRARSPESERRGHMNDIVEEDEILSEDGDEVPNIPYEDMTPSEQKQFKRASILKDIMKEKGNFDSNKEEEIRRRFSKYFTYTHIY